MKINEEDLKLIGGEFLTVDSVEHKWLYRYFPGRLSSKFITYYVTFRGLKKRVSLRKFCQLFTEHTGLYGSINTFCKIAKRIRELETAMENAEKSRDLALLSKIRIGEYK